MGDCDCGTILIIVGIVMLIPVLTGALSDVDGEEVGESIHSAGNFLTEPTFEGPLGKLSTPMFLPILLVIPFAIFHGGKIIYYVVIATPEEKKKKEVRDRRRIMRGW